MIKPGQVIKQFETKKGKVAIIRAPRTSDVQEITRMINSIVREDDYILLSEEVKLEDEVKWLRGVIKKNRKESQVYLLVEIDGKVVGSADVAKCMGRASHTGGFGIALEANHREEGIGSVLMETVINLAKSDLQLRQLKLEVYKTNIRALGLYKKMGFKIFGTLPKEVLVKNKYVDAVYMYKEI